ncbi:MAG: efflux RND transporter periplasmic adaptor subunit [Planctomycetota bacterium]
MADQDTPQAAPASDRLIANGQAEPEPDRPGARGPSGASAVVLKVVLGLLPVVIVVAAGGVAWLLLSTAPQQGTSPPEPLVPTVEVVPVKPASVPVTVEGFGVVRPAREAALAAEVTGPIVEIGDAVEPGGVMREGDLLVRIDPAEYELAVTAAEADLARAQADLELERGRGMIAQREWERFRKSLSSVGEEDRSAALANREPQLRQAEVAVLAADNAIAQAKLDLERTTVHAPFDAIVVTEEVEVGRWASVGERLLSLAGTRTFWVEAAVAPARAARLSAGQEATVFTDAGERPGRLIRVLPQVDAEGRMARVLVAVDDPIALHDDAPQLPIGAYVRVTFEAGEADGVVEVPRAAVRENQQVWVRDADGLLQYRDVDVRFAGEETSLLDVGVFEPGDAVIVSYLDNPLPGTPVRIRETQP